MSARLRRGAVAVSLAALTVTGSAVALVSTPAAAAPAHTLAPSPTAPAAGTERTTANKKILDYWTETRMRSATAEPVPVVTSQSQPQVKNVLPDQTAKGARPAKSSRVPQSPGASNRALVGPQAERWHRQGTLPATTIGKIYFVRTNGSRGYCTGSVINAANRNTVWTAGHCIHGGGGGTGNYFRDFIFVPDADNNREPHGIWTWRYANTTVGWQNNANFRYDIAAIAFNAQPQRGNLSDWLGYQGYRFGAGQNFDNIYAFGYPQDGYRRTDFTGNDLWYCFGAVRRASASDDRMHMNCDMFHGSSGGPWLQDLQLSRGWGYIIGINSHRDVDGNQNPVNIVYKSPYHGDAAINVYNDVTNR
ncbi:trypsin-like peptidase domain-containing protein [Streptosporangium soli]|nr:trypsin-like peptidase domain-containing protein [Streptosporangium sp. KLBMP 9127]